MGRVGAVLSDRSNSNKNSLLCGTGFRCGTLGMSPMGGLDQEMVRCWVQSVDVKLCTDLGSKQSTTTSSSGPETLVLSKDG